jgi:soluble lytic murein transglycosylase-like protein
MVRLYPRLLVFPSILLTAFFLLILSNSINVYTVGGIAINADHDQANSKIPIHKKQLSGKYPQSIQKWVEEIEYSADQYDLDPNLIAAVMLQESGGQPTVISTSGAVGLMQIMPRDGIASSFICGNNPCFKNRPPINELLDPDYNINFGTHLLSSLLKTSGSTRNALKAYGPMDVGFYYADIILSIYSSYK